MCELMSDVAVRRLYKQIFDYRMNSNRTVFHTTEFGLIKCCGPHPDKAKKSSCGKIIEIHEAYKCLYCNFFFCKTCAEKHFGKTINEYFEDKLN